MAMRWLLAIFAFISSILSVISTLHLVLFLSPAPTTADIADCINYTHLHRVGHNALLLSGFIALHSILATTYLKRIFTYLGISHIQRSTYSLICSLSLEFLIQNWSIITYPIWICKCPSLSIVYWLGCILTALSTCSVDILELVGIKQEANYYYILDFNNVKIYNYIYGYKPPMQYKSKPLQQLLKHSRHPFVTGPLLMLWSVQEMYLDRLLFSSATTLYLFYGYKLTLNDKLYIRTQLLKKLSILINESL